MEIEFTLTGNPKGKQKPRICKSRGLQFTYTPKQTIEYEKLVRASYTAISKMFFDKNIPLEVSIIALFSVTQSVSKSQKTLC